MMFPLSALLAVGLWYMGKDPKGPILTIAAIDGEQAAVLRRGFEERGYIHLVVVDREGDARWSEALFGVLDPPSVAAAGGQVFVRVSEARGNPALHAFDVETGAFAWKADPADPAAEPVSFGAPSLFATEEAIWELAGQDPVVVSVFDLAGELKRRLSITPAAEGAAHDAWVADDALVLRVGDRWSQIDSEGAERMLTTALELPNRSPASGEQCAPSSAGGTTWGCTDSQVIARETARR